MHPTGAVPPVYGGPGTQYPPQYQGNVVPAASVQVVAMPPGQYQQPVQMPPGQYQQVQMVPMGGQVA